MTTRKELVLAVLGLTALPLAACSHGDKKESAGQAKAPQSQGAQLGQTQQSPGTATIQTQEQVTQTVTRRNQIPTVRTQAVKADINRMKAQDFAALGFPKDQAQNIEKFRTENGPFRSVNDLAQVPGIDHNVLGKVSNKLGVSGQNQG